MSKTYDNSGTLGRNDRREKDSQPTHTGKCTIEGRRFYVNAWVKEGPNGKFFSLSFKPIEQKAEPAQREQVPGPRDDFDGDSEIPFNFAIAFPIGVLLASMVFGFGGMVA